MDLARLLLERRAWRRALGLPLVPAAPVILPRPRATTVAEQLARLPLRELAHYARYLCAYAPHDVLDLAAQMQHWDNGQALPPSPVRPLADWRDLRLLGVKAPMSFLRTAGGRVLVALAQLARTPAELVVALALIPPELGGAPGRRLLAWLTDAEERAFGPLFDLFSPVSIVDARDRLEELVRAGFGQGADGGDVPLALTQVGPAELRAGALALALAGIDASAALARDAERDEARATTPADFERAAAFITTRTLADV
jgi:hypothetical protein